MEKDIIKEYPSETLTVVWQPGKCIHCGKCAMGLSSVFKPREKPWINTGNASDEEIRAQVAKCPSGALSIK